ncbi:MAG: carboxypeptidase regulatory-like domain-containing protein [Candidatus Diapherotrites archaeon]|nr:carboxypeptidase regulatory-like domain-containing protein [Candidatus Diapherotrites archaeon]
MGLMDSVKEVYFSLEDKWYALMDSIEAKGIPVYKVIDPIDKIVPSFALFLGLSLIVLIALIALLFMFFFGSGKSMVSFIVSSNGTPLEGVSLMLSQQGNEEKQIQEIELEIETNENGSAKAELYSEIPLTVSASLNGYSSFEKTFDLIDEDGKKINLIEIELSQENFGPAQRTIVIYDSDSRVRIRKNASFTFSCTAGTAPPRKNTSSGEVTVSVAGNCTKLYAFIEVEGYKSSKEAIDNKSNNIYLNPESTVDPVELSGTGSVFVSVETELGNAVSGVEITIKNFVSGQEVESKLTSEAGTVLFTLDAFKNYSLELYYEESGFFEEKEFYLEEDEEKEFEFVITDEDLNANSKIFLKFIDSVTEEPLPAVSAYLINGNIPRLSKISNANGTVVFPWELENNSVLAVKAGYLTELVEDPELMDIDETVPEEVELIRATSENSVEVTVKVYYPSELGGGLVEGAYVLLFNDEEELWGFGSTDEYGSAEFLDLPEGTYFAGASLEEPELFGESDLEEAEAGDSIILNVTLDGTFTGMLQVDVNHLLTEQPIADANITVFEKGTSTVVASSKTDSTGLTPLIELPSSLEYDLNVSAEGFESIKQTTATIGANQTTIEFVSLVPEDFCEINPVNYFTGVWHGENKLVQENGKYELMKGTMNYTAKFIFCVPNKVYSKVVAHYMADEEDLLLADSNIVFTEAGETANYKEFDEIPTAADGKYSTNDSSDTAPFKVINYLFSDSVTSTGGTTAAKIKFRLNETAEDDETYSMYYGSYAKLVSGSTYEKTPLDKIDFISSNTFPVNGFEWSTDWNKTKTNGKYDLNKNDIGTLNFTLKNISGTDLSDLNIVLSSSGNSLDLNKSQFSFSLNAGQSYTDSIAVTGINLGIIKLDFNLFSRASAESEWEHRTEYKVDFNVWEEESQLKEMEMTFTPDELYAERENYSVNINLMETETNAPVNNAIITFRQNNQVIGGVLEQSNGNYFWNYNLPLQLVNGDIAVTASASGYRTVSGSIKVIPWPDVFETIDCIEFDKTRIELPASGNSTEYDVITITNNCSSTVEFDAFLEPTSDLLIGTVQEHARNGSVEFSVQSQESIEFYVVSGLFAGTHPIHFEMDLIGTNGDIISSGQTEVTVIVNPPLLGTANAPLLPFYLLNPENAVQCFEGEIDSCNPKYEFNIANTSDSAWIVYVNENGLWTATDSDEIIPWTGALISSGDVYKLQNWSLSNNVIASRGTVNNPRNGIEVFLNKEQDNQFGPDNKSDYVLLGVVDKENNAERYGVFHVKVTGYTDKCQRYSTPVIPDGETGEFALQKFIKTNNSYEWPSPNEAEGLTEIYERCSETYCDGAQTMQLVSYLLKSLETAFNEGTETDWGNYDGLWFITDDFDLLLKKEGYSKNLAEDFISSLGTSFLYTPNWMTGQSNIASFISNKTYFYAPAFQPDNVIEPGKYKVHLGLKWSQGVHRIFENVYTVIVTLEKIAEPEEQNLLYYLPFDSDLKDSEGKRNGYGVVLGQNSISEGLLKEFELLPRNPNAGGIVTLTVDSENGSSGEAFFNELNNPSYRSSLLSITGTGNQFTAKQRIGYPSIVGMNLNYETPAQNTFYKLKLNNELLDGLGSNDSFTRWTGVKGITNSEGECVEFSGEKLPKFFPDVNAKLWKENNFIAPLSNDFIGISFAKINVTEFLPGSVSLAGIFFVPDTVQKQPCFIPNSDEGFLMLNNQGFCSQNQEGYRLSKINHPKILSLNDILADAETRLISMVENEEACAYADATKFELWWNEDKLIKENPKFSLNCYEQSESKHEPIPNPPWGEGV